MKTILGTGQLGVAIMEVLLKRNPDEEITMVNRNGTIDLPLRSNVRVIAADATNAEHMRDLASRSDVMFSCTDVPYPMWSSFYPAVANALASALSTTKTKVVFADNLYSYGNVEGAVMHEDLPHKAKTRKGMIRASVINTLLFPGKEYSERVSIVKAADFIGPRIYKGLFGTDFLEKLTKGKTIILPGKIKLPHTFTYIHDFATAMVNVGTASDTFGKIWHVPNATAMGIDRWLHLFEVMTTQKAKIMVLPKFVVRIAGWFNPMIREYYELAYQFDYPYLVDHSKYVARFGDHSTSPSTIVKETVKWFESRT